MHPPHTVTFDSNVLNLITIGDPKADHRDAAAGAIIKQALQMNRLQGFVCETVATLEGIRKHDRVPVFASTQIVTRQTTKLCPESTSGYARLITTAPEQPARQLIDVRQLDRLDHILALGFRFLASTPRVGMVRIADPGGSLYARDAEFTGLEARMEKQFALTKAFGSRGVGVARAEALAAEFAQRDGVIEVWWRSLGRAQDAAQTKRVIRAVQEWSDGELVAAHISYGLDYLCTMDRASNAERPSVFDCQHRAWLRESYGVEVLSPQQLAARVSNEYEGAGN